MGKMKEFFFIEKFSSKNYINKNDIKNSLINQK